MKAWLAVRDLIRMKCKTQKEVAHAMGRSDNYIGSMISQGGSPSIELYNDVLRAVGGYQLAVVDEGGKVVYRVE